MRLDEYQWSRNPRGMHNKSAAERMNFGKLIEMKLGWAKLVTLGPDYLDLIELMLVNNVTPIVRIWRPRFGAGAPDAAMISAWRQYIAAGVRWFEFYNEPNLDNEWPEGRLPHYQDIEGTIAPLMTNWLAWAELMIGLGAYPAFPALAEATGPALDVTRWLDVMLNYLAEHYYDRFRAVAGNGLWCATHPYIYNHFYQEGAGPLDPRPPDAQRAEQPGWHFEYPYDPITQADKPGLTSVSGPAEHPLGDPIGLTGMGYAFIKKFQQLFGGGAVPVVGTEGGITPVPTGPADFHQLDKRFPGYGWQSHAEATLAMFNWLALESPPWMFGLTLWKEDDYYEGPGGEVPAVWRLAGAMPFFKNVPPIEPLEGPGPRELAALKGPGPIHGTPDYHFLVIAPGFNAGWFFEQGRAYWERFRPTLMPTIDFIGNLPYQKSLGVTVLTTPEMAQYMKEQISERWTTVWVDMLAVEDAETLAKALQERVNNGRRFG